MSYDDVIKVIMVGKAMAEVAGMQATRVYAGEKQIKALAEEEPLHNSYEDVEGEHKRPVCCGLKVYEVNSADHLVVG